MKSTLRRLAAVVALATSTAVVASVVVAPSASAAIVSITPNTAFVTESAKEVRFTFSESDSGTYFLGGEALFTRLGSPAATFTVDIDPTFSFDGKAADAEIDVTDVGDGLFSDGPADAGTYGVRATDARDTVDSCTSCFTVLNTTPMAVTTLAPNSLRAGQSGGVVVTGAGFERGSRIEVLLPSGAVDPTINADQAPPEDGDRTTTDDTTDGITTGTTLRRTFTVGAGAVTGSRDVRVTNLDGRSVTQPDAFSVNGAPLSGVSPVGAANDPGQGLTRVTFTGGGLNPSGKPFLAYTADPGSSTREALTVPGTLVSTPTATTFVADFDLRNAAPQAYQPQIRNPDGSVNACGCAFTVAQAPTRVTTVSSLDSDTSTSTTEKSQPAGTTQSFVVNGTNFAKGTRVVVSGAGVTTTAVEFVSPTQLRATFSSTPAAAAGDRSVTATRTDGRSSAACAACYTVGPTASPAPTASPTASPSADPSAATPTVNINPTSIIAVEEKALVFGNAQPGSTVEVFAYSRPSTTYQRVRSARVGANGTYRFEVGPSGNTRLFARATTVDGRVGESGSIVLTVQTSINLKVTRTGTRTYRFTGSTLPKRRGQLVTVFYQADGANRVIASRARVQQDGTYDVTRTFGGTGTFELFTATGTDISNAGNESRRVRTTIR